MCDPQKDFKNSSVVVLNWRPKEGLAIFLEFKIFSNHVSPNISLAYIIWFSGSLKPMVRINPVD